ncbi:LCP family protein [Kitasatospora sp. McL0602]|uniref:LCP family protein n=1 Tax=Kitasatospora sp. McL0602 TaxID=3439530 RepID=UPI003F8CBFCE
MADPRRRSPLLLAGRSLACAVSVAVFGTCGLTWYEYHSLEDGLTKSDALKQIRQGAPPRLDNAVNLLLIGLDSRKDMDGNDLPPQVVSEELHAGSSSDIGGYNTNTLMVLHIPPGGGKVTALSIPRDDYVQTVGADGRMHKIKEAYEIAKARAESKLAGKGLAKAELERRSREAGRASTLATVQQFLGIPIDHFAEVNLIGFYDIAKALEPIQVCLNKAVSDPIVSRTATREGGGTGLKLPAGISSLNAAQALSFVRQRHNLPGGDLDRTHRQQAFISSVEYKLKQQGIFDDLGRMQQLFEVVKKDVVLDSAWNILDFAQQAPNLTSGNVEFNTLPITGFKTVGGQDVNLVDPDLIKRIVRQLTGHDPAPAGPPPPSSSSATPPTAPSESPAATSAPELLSGTVDVYNASTVAHAAAAESRALVALGLAEGRIGTGTTHPKVTTVAYGSGSRAAAEAVAARYGVTATPAAAAPAGHVVVTLGTSYTAPATSAETAEATAPASGSAEPEPSALPMQGPAVKAGGIPCVN